MEKAEKAKLLRNLKEKFNLGDAVCLNNGEQLPLDELIAWVYERKDLDEMKIDDRKREFGLSLKPFYEDHTYPRAFLADFFTYWTEPAKSGKRLRWELEKTWSLPARLRRFAKNSKYKITLPPSEMDFLDGKVENNKQPINSDNLFH